MLKLGWVSLNNILTRQILNEGNFNPTLKAEVPIEKMSMGFVKFRDRSKIHLGNGDANTEKYYGLFAKRYGQRKLHFDQLLTIF
jgi:hypothetical protein